MQESKAGNERLAELKQTNVTGDILVVQIPNIPEWEL